MEGRIGDNVQYTYQYYDPATNNIFESVNTSNQKFSPDRLSTSAPNISITAKDGTHTFETSKPHQIKVTFTPISEGYKLGHGRALFGSGADPSYVSHAFMPRGKVSGELKQKNGAILSLEGVGFLVHAMQRDRPYLLAERWNFAVFHSKRVTLNLMEFHAPKNYGGVWMAQSALVLDGQLRSATGEAHQTVLEEVKDNSSGYSIPKRARFNWKGADWEASIEVEPTLSNKIDLLKQLPWMIRKFIQAFVTSPYDYMFWDKVTVHLRLEGGEEIVEEGWMAHEVAFMN